MLDNPESQPATPVHLGGGSNAGEYEVNLFYMIKLILRRSKLVFAGGALGGALALLFAFLYPDLYTSTTTLEVRAIRENAGPDPVHGNVISEGAVTVQSLEDIATTAEKVKSFEFLSRVAALPEIQALFESKKAEKLTINKRVKELNDWITVDHVPDTRLLKITATQKTPEAAAQLANSLARVIIEVGVASRSEVANQFIDDLDQDFSELNTRVLNAQQRLALYSRSVDIREALAKARQEIEKLSSRYKSKHPAMLDATSTVLQLQDSLVEELDFIRTDRTENEFWGSFASSQTDAKDQAGAIVEHLMASRVAFLTSELQGLSDLYNDLNKSLSEIRMANNSDDLDLKIFEPAFVPDWDDTANISKAVLLVAGATFGGGLGAMAALLLGLLQRNARSAEEWNEKSSMPLLGEVMRTRTLLTSPNAHASHQIRAIRSQLCAHQSPLGKQSILVASALPGEGKTTLAIALAKSFAQIQSQTVLIDLNLYRPALHETLRLDGAMGVSEVITRRLALSKAIQEYHGFDVIPAGRSCREAIEILTPVVLRDLIAQLTDIYHVVIIDGSPALCSPEAKVLAGVASSTVIVVNAQSSAVGDVNRAAEMLMAAGGRVEAVLNNVVEQDAAYTATQDYVAGNRMPLQSGSRSSMVKALVDQSHRPLTRVINFATQLEGGGAQMVAAQLRSGFLELGCESSLLAFLYQKRQFELPGPRPCILAERRPGILGLPQLLVKTYRLLQQERPDIVLSHSVYTNLFVLPMAWLLRTPHRVTVQHNETQDVSVLNQRLYALFHFLRITTHTVFVSEASYQSYASKFKCFKGNSSVVKNIISLNWGSADCGVLDLVDLQPGSRLLFCAGRLSPQKNHAVLIEAMKHVPDCKLVIAGEGELRPALEAQIRDGGLEDSVLLLGEIPRESIVALFGVCDLFVMPSLYEGRSLAMLEAAEAGCQIVASKIPSFEELLEPFSSRVSFFNLDSATDLAEKIRDSLSVLPKWRALDHRVQTLKERAEKAGRSVNVELCRSYCQKVGWSV